MENVGNLLLYLSLMLFVAACGSKKEADFLDRMEAEHKDDTPVENAAAELQQKEQTTGEEVTYATIDNTDITGYLATPENTTGAQPGLIVIHEWWGLNDNIRMMTDKLAGEGYTALAVDLYKGKVAETPDNAGTYARSVNKQEAIDNLTQAYTYLTEKQGVQKIGTIGWCFGGGWSLQMALAHPKKIDATVIYYGRLVTDAKRLEELQMPVLGLFGAKDSGIPPERVKAFESALNKAGVTNKIYVYDGAGHAFANPSGQQYQREAAEDAWQKTKAFLAQYLK